MNHTYAMHRAEYENYLERMVVTRKAAVNSAANNLLTPAIFKRHAEAAKATGVPHVLIATIDLRESDCNPMAGLGQGDRWDRVSTHVPKGKGPFKSWADATAYYLKYDHLTEMGPWSLAKCAYAGERWNGWGVRDYHSGRVTGYLWSGTSIYDPPAGKGGKYVSDGKWSGSTVDKQLGIIPVMRRLIELKPELAPGDEPPMKPGVLTGMFWIQDSLNRALQLDPPLLLDGSMGRATRAAVSQFQEKYGLKVDGTPGEEVCNKLDEINLLGAAHGSAGA